MQGFAEQQRRFFYPPDVVQLQDSSTSVEPVFDVVLIGSGYRASPLSRTVHDRLYMLRDRAVNGLVDAGNGEAALDDRDGAAVNRFFTLNNDDLLDVTDNLIQDGSEDERIAQLELLRESHGWRIDLLENGSPIGEKNLSSPRVLFGQAFFTTFVPPQTGAATADSNTCGGIGESFGRVYALDILRGTAVAGYDPSNDTPNGDDPGIVNALSDRVHQLDEGIPSSVLFIFLQNGIRPIVDQNVLPNQFPINQQQIYWRQN